MKLIIAGGRDFNNPQLLLDTMVEHFGDIEPDDLTIISGGAQGADSLGERFAHTFKIKIERYPADWSKGQTAGFKRNIEMAKQATHLLAFHDTKSKGTAHMIATAKRYNLPTIVVNY